MASKSKSKIRKKGKGTGAQPGGFGRKSLQSELQRITGFLQRNKLEKAYDALTNLSHTYPDHPDVLVEWANYYAIASNLDGYQKTCERLMQMDGTQSLFILGLANSYLASGSPLLALKTFRTVAQTWPAHHDIDDITDKIASLEAEVESLLSDLGLPNTADGLEAATQHEQVQRYLSRGEYEAACQLGEALLQRVPEVVSIHNNLSLAYLYQDDVQAAIRQSQCALEKEEGNIHALSNLVRYYVYAGEVEKATALVSPLLTSTAKAFDPWTKKLEALSYLGDYEAVLEVYEQAQASGELAPDASSDFCEHLAAVAMARCGRLREARQLWQGILARSPQFYLASENLKNSNQPITQQFGAWAFALQQWMPPRMVHMLQEKIIAGGLFDPTADSGNDLEDDDKEQALRDLITEYLAECPHIDGLLPRLLEQGGPDAVHFAWMIVNSIQAPAHLEAMKTFALGKWGPDEFRYQVALSTAQAGYISKNVRLWLNGAWKEVTLMAYEFHGEPEVVYGDEVVELLGQALELLKQMIRQANEEPNEEPDGTLDEDPDEEANDPNTPDSNTPDSNTSEIGAEAERLLQQALALAPDAPDLRHNLAALYHQQGREEEAIAIWTTLMEEAPTYVHARTTLARLHLKNDDIDAAQELLVPLLEADRFHYDHFAEFSDAYMQLLMAQGQTEGAKNWLHMWSEVDPEHPRLFPWQLQFTDPEELQRRLDTMA